MKALSTHQGNQKGKRTDIDHSPPECERLMQKTRGNFDRTKIKRQCFFRFSCLDMKDGYALPFSPIADLLTEPCLP